MPFLFRLFFSRAAVYVAVAMNTFDAIGLTAAVLSGETTADLQTVLTIFGFGS